MLVYLVLIGVVHAVSIFFPTTSERGRSGLAAGSGLACWTLLASYAGSLSEVGRAGFAGPISASIVAIFAATLSGPYSLRVKLIPPLVAAAGVGFLAVQDTVGENLPAVAAVILLVGALAATALSSRKAPEPLSEESADPVRDVVAVVAAAAVSLATLTLFSNFLDRGLASLPIEGWSVRVCLIAAAAALIGFIVNGEIRCTGQPVTGSAIVVMAALLVVAVGQEAVLPACSLAACVLLAPLIAMADQSQEPTALQEPDHRSQLIDMIEEDA